MTKLELTLLNLSEETKALKPIGWHLREKRQTQNSFEKLNGDLKQLFANPNATKMADLEERVIKVS
ncbi:MAG: hypothetical protein IPK55_15220 [Streptococcus sp.]|nr:hypothetical protein [Streptococcus sp.]